MRRDEARLALSVPVQVGEKAARRIRGPRQVRMHFNLRAASGTADEMRIEHTRRVFGE